MKELFEEVKEDYRNCNELGYKTNDQFVLFMNVLDDFQAYYAMYIAIRSSNWDRRISSIKMMVT